MVCTVTQIGLPPWPSRPAVFLDFDGTLVEIVSHPSLSEASPRLRRLLERLPEACGGALAIISGRRIEDVDRILAPHRFPAAGVHGLEHRGIDGVIRSPEPDESIALLRRRVDPFLALHEGVWIEDKTTAFAVHYRSRPDLAGEIHAFVQRLQSEIPPDVEILHGNHVFEIKPATSDKGRAIERFMTGPPFAGRTPVFIGDDVTDEAGFRSLKALGGVTVKVGAAPTLAQWRLAGVSDVLGWLEQLLEAA